MPIINLGNLNIAGGKTTVGLSSGLPVQEIIDAQLASEKAKINKISDEIELSDKKLEAYDKLEEHLLTLHELMNLMRLPPNLGGLYLNNDGTTNNKNIFDSRKLNISSSNPNINPDLYVGFQVLPGTPILEYTIEDIITAKSKRETSQAFSSKTTSVTTAAGDPQPGLFTSGTFTITNNGNSADVTIEEGYSLSNIASAIKAVSNITQVDAYIINAGSSNYYLVLQSKQPGNTYAYTIDDSADSVLSNVTFTLSASADASATINGFPVSSTNNVIEDFTDGFSVTLYHDSLPGDQFTAEVEINIEPAKEGIMLLVETVNEVLKFYARQTARDSNGRKLDTAYLAREAELSSLVNDFNRLLDSTITGLPSDSKFNSLYQIGVTRTSMPQEDEFGTPEGTYILTVDEEALTGHLNENFESVREIFEFQERVNSPFLKLTKRSNLISVPEFTLTIDESKEDKLNKAMVTIGSKSYHTLFQNNGTKKIIGLAGTPIAGLEMMYTGSGTDTITVSYSQGLADKLYNFARSTIYSTEYYNNIGVVTIQSPFFNIAENSLNSSISRYEKDIEDIEHRMSIKRANLESKFFQMELAYQKAAQIIARIEAEQAAMQQQK